MGLGIDGNSLRQRLRHYINERRLNSAEHDYQAVQSRIHDPLMIQAFIPQYRLTLREELILPGERVRQTIRNVIHSLGRGRVKAARCVRSQQFLLHRGLLIALSPQRRKNKARYESGPQAKVEAIHGRTIWEWLVVWALLPKPYFRHRSRRRRSSVRPVWGMWMRWRRDFPSWLAARHEFRP